MESPATTTRLLTSIKIAVGMLLTLSSARAHAAGDLFFETGNTLSYQQTSNAMPTTPTGASFTASAIGSQATFTSAVLTYPGAGSPLNLPLVLNNHFQSGPTQYASESDLHTTFPFGSYTITGTASDNSTTSATYSFASDNFASSTPYLTDFESLSGFDPTQDKVIHFPSFTANPATSGPEISLIISDTLGGLHIVQEYGNTATTTSATILANALLPNTTYKIELDYAQNLGVKDSTGQQTMNQSSVLSDLGTFTTGVPEPVAIFPLLTGLGLITLGRRSRAIRLKE